MSFSTNSNQIVNVDLQKHYGSFKVPREAVGYFKREVIKDGFLKHNNDKFESKKLQSIDSVSVSQGSDYIPVELNKNTTVPVKPRHKR
mmetsp:Transcript_21079/g.15430  ORF Transcript_21079/g.15430 Transcript_21079/m.15430 type:complete len:88 (-) Transcript_21079:108-371(-)